MMKYLLNHLDSIIGLLKNHTTDSLILILLTLLVTVLICKFFYRREISNKNSSVEVLEKKLSLLECEKEVSDRLERKFDNPVWEKERHTLMEINAIIQKYLTEKT